MGLLSKHKGSPHKLSFVLHVHTLSPWPAGPKYDSLAITWSRGGKHGGSKRAGPVQLPGTSFATYTFEEALAVPATLYQVGSGQWDLRGRQLPPRTRTPHTLSPSSALPQDAGKHSKSGQASYERKELQLQVVRVDGKGKAQGSPVGTVTLNLADYAGMRTQQSFAVACDRDVSSVVGTPKLLVTIVGQEAGQGGTAPVVQPVAAAAEDVITSLSTDEESGSSRPSSRNQGSRVGSLPGDLQPRLASVPEGVGRPRESLAAEPSASSLSARFDSEGFLRDTSVEGSPSPQQPAGRLPLPPAAEPSASSLSGRYDSDGFMRDTSVEGSLSPSPQQPAARVLVPVPEAASVAVSNSATLSDSVRRDLGSAMLHADSGAGGAPPAAAVDEAQSRRVEPPGVAGPSELPPAASLAAAAGRGPEQQGGAATPLDHLGARGLASPEPWSTGPASSLSAGMDPAAPFSVPPSTQRRFVRPEGAPGRRWAWRKDVAPLPPGAPGSQFQMARLASSSQAEAAAAATTSAAGAESASSGPSAEGLGVELSTASVGSESSHLTNGRASADLDHLTGRAEARAAAGSIGGSVFSPPSMYAAARPPSAEGALRGARVGSGAQAAFSLLPAPSSASSIDGAVLAGAAAVSQAVVDALARELRTAAALEVRLLACLAACLVS